MVSGIPSEPGSMSIIFTLLIIAVIVAIRFRRIRTGTKVSGLRAIGYMATLGALSAFIVASSFLSVGIPILFVIPYGATVVASAFAGYRYSKKSLVFWKDASGSINVKGGIGMFAIYVAAMLVRVGLGLAFGNSAFYSIGESDQPHSISSTLYLASIVIDFLMMFGAGLFIGRNIRVYKQYSLIQKGKVSVSEI